MLKGYKTYIFAALLVLNNVATAAGLMTPETAELLNWVFGGGALASVRAGIGNTGS